MIATDDRPPQLWVASVDAPLPSGAEAWLDGNELARLARLKRPEDRRRRTLGWCLRRWGLSRLRPDIGEAEWRFVLGANGKPALAPPFDRLELEFSLSHSGSFAAILLAKSACGVDVEAPPPGLEAMDVAFTAAERADVHTHPTPISRFLQYWVAKEAVLKLVGSGVLDSLDRLELSFPPSGLSPAPTRASVTALSLPDDLRLHLWRLPLDHWLAAAWCGSGPAPTPATVPWPAA